LKLLFIHLLYYKDSTKPGSYDRIIADLCLRLTMQFTVWRTNMIDLDRYTEVSIQNTMSAISGLVVYSHVKDDPLIAELKDLLTEISRSPYSVEKLSDPSIQDTAGKSTLYTWMDRYTHIYAQLMNNNLSEVPDLGQYVLSLVQKDDNAFARMASGRYAGAKNISIDPLMRQYVLADFERILILSAFQSRNITSILSSLSPIALPEWRHDASGQTPVNLYEALLAYHHEKSFGVFASFHAFLWKDHKLEPVAKPDPIRLEQLFSYNYEISQVQENTMRLLRHKRADNILLFGARGTGKSSTVKAMSNTYKDQGLRLIEVDKDDLLTIAELLSYLTELSDVRLSFILFLDDLTFSEDDMRYTVLKTLLEGGIKTRPENVAIYATSNRRHIVAEKDTNETYANDAKDEKLSLSDRFGISVRFASPNQQVYLDIVFGILTDRQIPFDREITAQKALTWAMRENGRSPRTARQFADYYEATFDSPVNLTPTETSPYKEI